MIDRRRDARTRPASGRFVRLTAVGALALGAWSCASGGGGEAAAPAPAFPDPVLAEGPIAPSAEAHAARLVLEAEEALAARDHERAAAAAREVVEEHPAAPVSGRALWLLARATRATGDLREADAHAQRFARLLMAGDPRLTDVRLLQGSALVVAGEGEAAVRRLLALPDGTPPEAMREAVGLARSAGAGLDADTLAGLAAEAHAGHPFVPVLLAARARLLYNRGEGEAAAEAAEAALAAGAEPPEEAVARGVLEGRVDAGLGLTGPVAVLGTVLPAGGSPGLREYARLIEEGVRAALASASTPGRLEIVAADGGGAAAATAAAVRDLASGGALAMVGPLQSATLAAAAAARERPIPVVSPTAPETPPGEPNVYTLLGLDPGASRALAAWAASAGLRRVVVVHSLERGSQLEADVFGRAFQEAGGAVLRTLDYPSGSTDFAVTLREAAALRPDAVVFPVPPEDLEVLAPQITFYGLDTLGIHVLGTGAWTDDEVRRAVGARHLDGVVVAATDDPAEEVSGGYLRFVEAYESTHRRTLRSPVPALGYDAASLLLEALATGARAPDDLARALEALEGFEGATGTLSVEDGRVVREHHVVCLRGGRLLPVRAGEAPLVVDRRPPDTLVGERPVPSGLPFVRVCPGEAAPLDGVPLGADGPPAPPPGALPAASDTLPPSPHDRSRSPS